MHRTKDLDWILLREDESKKISRRCVHHAELLSRDAQGITLRTHTENYISAWDLDENASNEGRLRIDVLADSMLRIRYAEGTQIPDAPSPMIVQMPKGAGDYKLIEKDSVLELQTARAHIRIELNPYRIRICNERSEFLAGIGGPPKGNHLDSHPTGLYQDPATQRSVAHETFDLRSGEAVYGFGERFTNLNKVGQRVDLVVEDTMSVSSPGAYKNTPFFMSTHGYGVFFNHSCRMSVWVGSLSSCDIQAALQSKHLDYFVFLGSLKEILHAYTGLTGRGEVPPRWSFGFWQSRYMGAPDLMKVAESLREHRVPCDVLCLDADWMTENLKVDLEFNKKIFPDPKKSFTALRKMGFRICAWQMPYVSGSLFEALRQVDGLVKTKTGEPYKYGKPGSFEGYITDFTNPEARRVYKEKIKQVLRAGVSVIKVDFGEWAPVDGVYHGGKDGREIHNLYPLLYNQTIYEATKEETGEGLIWGRSTWAGSQRYPLHWGGDPRANLENIVTELAGGLSFGLSGFQFWSFDIGGFFGTPSERMFLRSLQLGLFISHSRAHGMGKRELYEFSPETLRIGREYVNLRYRLLPYLYGTACECIRDSLPMARALVVEYQDDPTTWNIADEFLLGRDLLVAPILSEEDERRVYLPAGMWTDWWTGERIPGARWIKVQAGLETLPLYVREGGVVVLGPEMQYVDERPADAYEVRVALFEQDGETTAQVFEDGKWWPLLYRAKQGRHQLVVPKLKGQVQVKALGTGTIEVSS